MGKHWKNADLHSYICMALLTQVTALPTGGRTDLARLMFGHRDLILPALATVCASGDSHVAGVMIKVSGRGSLIWV
jgi:hypothetical protein